MNSTLKTSLRLAPLATMFLLAACQTTHTVATRAGCLVFDPITYSSRDTPETAKQVQGHNAAYDSYCRGRK